MSNQEMNFTIYKSKRNADLYCAEVKTGGSVLAEEPVKVALLLDTSGSMKGDRLETLKQTMKAFFRCLKGTDYLTLIQYASDASLLCADKRFSSQSLEEWDQLAECLQAEGNTNMSAAVSLLAKSSNGSSLHAVVLLTDGIVNSGVTSARAILLPLQTHISLKNVPIYTLGIGKEHNQIMLRDMAGASGNYFYLDKSENLPTTFGSILGILRDRYIEELTLGLPVGFTWSERATEEHPAEIYISYLPASSRSRYVFRRSDAGAKMEPYLSVQYRGANGLRESQFTMNTHNLVNLYPDVEAVRLMIKDALEKASGFMSRGFRGLAFEILEEANTKIAEDKDIVVDETVLCLRGILIDMIESLRNDAPAYDILGGMTSITTSLSAQRSSNQQTAALYATESIRQQSQNVAEAYTNFLVPQ